MKRSALAAGIRRLRGVLAVQGRHDDSDEQLLHAFTTQHDDNAFAVLVRRYGPLVLGVCRRVLRHHQDAEDAFQATFLLLSRNAVKLRDKTALASWSQTISFVKHCSEAAWAGSRQPMRTVDSAWRGGSLV